MANLSSALNYALSGLSVSASQSAVVSRNVSSAGDENYTRKTAQVVTLSHGGPVVSQIARSSDRQLLDKLLATSSDAAAQQIGLDALNRLSALTGDPKDGTSIAAGLTRLQDALRGLEQNPASTVLARSAVEAARGVALQLNQASDEVSAIRSEADQGMAEAAERIGNLLTQFKVVNDSIVRGQGTASDLSEDLDQRDAILKLLSEEIGIRTTVRTNNDVLIFAAGGAVLFEGSPRNIRFTPSGVLQPGVTGGALSVDGVQVTGPGAAMPVSGGRMSAYVAVRDDLGPELARQLDQIAAGLIRAFSESDPQLPASLPTVEGLFQGNGTIPDLNTPNDGLAAMLRLNPLADPEQAGSVLLLRDGGFGGAGYVRNTNNYAGFQARIAELADAIDNTQSFAAVGGIGGQVSVKALSLQSSSWVEGRRQESQSALDNAAALKSRAAGALAKVTGINIDQEMATLLDLEKSYQASAKILSIVDSMFGTLFEAVRR